MLKHVFQKKTSKNATHEGTVDPRTQTEMAPERAKYHRTTAEIEKFIHVLAAKVPSGLRTPPSLPDPTSLAAKDYPGLGDPNTLK